MINFVDAAKSQSADRRTDGIELCTASAALRCDRRMHS